MFEWIKKRFVREQENLEAANEMKPILITIHGFGTRRSLEMNDFAAWSKDHLPELIAFDLFDSEDENDCDWHEWVKRAEIVLKKAQSEKREIYLLGFSMGGVIAAYLATQYPVKKLILIAPAFIHFNIENYTNIVIKSASVLLSSKNEEVKKVSLPKSFYSSFLDCVKHLKSAISDVTCPVLLIQGDDDEVISTRSSEWAFNQIKHDQKRCVFLHGGKHRVLSDTNVNQEAFLLIQLFIEDKILPIQAE